MNEPPRKATGSLHPPLDQDRRLQALNRIATAIARDFDLDSIVQTVTDAGTELTGARFGAFFYNLFDEQGERYQLFTLAGAPREAFEGFGMPRNTPLFEPTFRGFGVIRSDDIRADPRYGKFAPHFGMPEGHLPVVSYLAVPVMSRSGEIHGGLFFGHEQPGIFTQEAEDIAVIIATHAAIALDNARILQAAKNEVKERRRADENAERLAAIVESSEDAIVSKDTHGIITSWNAGAERLFGYSPEEVIGRPVTILIPADRQDEEPVILGRILKGERVDHYETIRQRKDGSLIDISLTVSPIKDGSGAIIGASKIARDITERKRAQERQMLLLREMNHRVKNLFAVASGVVSLSARSAETTKEMVRAVQDRLSALARAHEMTLPSLADETARPRASLKALVETILSPYADGERRLEVDGCELQCGPGATTAFALLLHEFATNSMKYGALSRPEGQLTVQWSADEDLELTWIETGGPAIKDDVRLEGFGSFLAQATVNGLNGRIAKEWKADGVCIRLTVPVKRVEN